MTPSVGCCIIRTPGSMFRHSNRGFSIIYIKLSVLNMYYVVFWLFFFGIPCRYSNPHLPVKPKQTLTLTRQNPYPWERVRVCTGKGTGSPGKPQGYPRQSLILGIPAIHPSPIIFAF